MKLTEEQWRWIEPLVPQASRRKDGKGRPPTNRRQLLQGMLWILKTGARWQDLPKDRFPPYQTSIYEDALESSSLLPTSAIARSHQLKMDELCVATKEDGEWSDYFRGSRVFDE